MKKYIHMYTREGLVSSAYDNISDPPRIQMPCCGRLYSLCFLLSGTTLLTCLFDTPEEWINNCVASTANGSKKSFSFLSGPKL